MAKGIKLVKQRNYGNITPKPYFGSVQPLKCALHESPTTIPSRMRKEILGDPLSFIRR
jgi:hypothetical protein